MTSEQVLPGVERIAHRLIHRAARRAPGELSERLEEEWLADLAARRPGFPRLRFALGCCWAGAVIAHEQGAAAVAVVRAPLMPQGKVLISAPEGPPRFSGRTVAFVLVAILHAVLLYAFANGLGGQIIKVLPGDIQMRFLPDQPHVLPPPTLPSPQPYTTKFRDELPDIPLTESDNESPIFVERTQPTDMGSSPSAPTVPSVKRVPGGPGTGFPSTGDFYPPQSVRLNEEGVATVEACVDSHGRLTAEPVMVQSTGFSRLDQAALKLAKAGSGHYRAATEDGRPVSACSPFRIRFSLGSPH